MPLLHRASFLLAALLGLAAGLQACAHADGTQAPAHIQAQQQWQATGLQDYQFTFTQHCFCRGENQGAMVVRVKKGAVHSATWVNNQQPVSADALRQVPSVDAVFQTIQAGYARPAAEIRLTFNPQYGYPGRVFIDYDKRMADEELIYELSDLHP